MTTDAYQAIHDSLEEQRCSTDVLLTLKEYCTLTRQHHSTVRLKIREGTFRWPVERDSPRAHIKIRVPRTWLAALVTPAA